MQQLKPTSGEVRAGLASSRVDLVELDTDVDDPAFATAMAETLAGYLAAR